MNNILYEARLVLPLALLSSLFLWGCHRPSTGNLSTITINVPKASNERLKLGGVGTMSAMPSNRKACYGVNVTGPGITSESVSCGFRSGLLAGFVEAGNSLQILVPKGRDRKVELYAFFEDVGQNIPCPQLSSRLSALQLLNTFHVGDAANVDILADVTDVTIDASFPGLSNYLAQELALPATCTASANLNNPPGFAISAVKSEAVQSGIKIIGGVGRPAVSQATGTGIKLISK